MVLSGVSNQEALVVLLFLETAWWGTNYLGILVPSFIGYPIKTPPSVLEWAEIISIVTVSTLRFLSVGIFWMALVQNEISGMKSKLKVWYSTSLILDILILLILGTVAVNYGKLHMVIGATPIFIVLRTVFWISASLILRSTAALDEEGLPSTGPLRNWNSTVEKSFLLWEVFWYPIVIIGGLQLLTTKSWDVMLPIHNITHLDTVTIYTCVFIAALVTLLGILRNCKVLLKFWIFIYIGVALLYCGVNAWELLVKFHRGRAQGRTGVGISIDVGIAITFALIPTILRLITVIRTLKFAYTTTKEDPEVDTDNVFTGNDAEKRPLINALGINFQTANVNSNELN